PPQKSRRCACRCPGSRPSQSQPCRRVCPSHGSLHVHVKVSRSLLWSRNALGRNEGKNMRPHPQVGPRSPRQGELFYAAVRFADAAFAKVSTIFSLNAGMSSGLRLVTRLPSATTCSSTHSAPAFFRSVCSDEYDVSFLPRTT